MKRTASDDALLTGVLLELQAGGIREAFMPRSGPYRFVRGQCADDGQITVNPIHDTVDTLIHELLHRLHPAWTDRYVRRTTTYFDADPFHYSRAELGALAGPLGLAVEFVGDWGHPRGQRMACFRLG